MPLHVGNSTGLALLAAAFLLAASAAAAAVDDRDVCSAGPCPAVTQPRSHDPGLRVAEDLSDRLDRFKRERIRMCCRKHKAGLPLKGYMCSRREVERAYRWGICTR